MIYRLHSALLLLLLLVAVIWLSAPPALSQTAGAVPGGTSAASAADAELWRAIRQGEAFTTNAHNDKAGVLIQAQGHGWQQFRDGPLSMGMALALGGVTVLLCLFYALRGRVRIDAGPAGTTIKRFSLLERAAHWTLAVSFILLGLTGLNLLFGRAVILPWMGAEGFAAMTALGKLIHNYVSFAFMAALALVAVLWVAHNLPSRHDLGWILRGGGLFGGGHPPAKKFNAGQKLIFWTVILCGVSISLSGWALLYPFTTSMMGDTFAALNGMFGTSLPSDLTPVQEQQLQASWHVIMAAIMMAVIIAHIYIGSVGMEGAIDAMGSGDVDLNWAREHHSLWVEEVEAQAPSASRARPRAGPAGTPAE